MKQINQKKMSELENHILELGCIAYLQSVIQYDNYTLTKDIAVIYDEAKNYLIEKEIEVVVKLRELFYSKDFAVSIK